MTAAPVSVEPWSIPGAHGETILGDRHAPARPRAVMLLAHGFKGYKDYGMFPHLARTMAADGLEVHRFNFSHSGMTNDVSTFARPDLFERDTWNRQVEDLRAVIDAFARPDLPTVLFGHSRGGVATLLTVGRGGVDVAGVVTAASPSTCCSLDDDAQRALLEQGFLESPSARTGQALRVGRAFLQEQIDAPSDHDLRRLVATIDVPVALVHGADDPTVPASSAHDLAAAIGPNAEVTIVPGANHVFDTPNPMPDDARPSPALEALTEAMRRLVDRALAS